MTHYMRTGNRFSVTPEGAIDITELLPLGTYKVGYIPEPVDDFFLEKIEDFESPGRIYGDVAAQRDRILRTFNDRPGSTGVLLSGAKGSGKTLMAKLLSLQGQETGIPTVVINQPYVGDTFNAFIQSIEQPMIVLFDEFEKVYEAKHQERLLTLLDGVYPSKKLFVLTTNDRWRVDEHMRNRPGRIYYRLEYKGLDQDFVRGYCLDNLENAANTEDVVRASSIFTEFNFDMLKALVEEMNRYGETAEEAMKMLNARPETQETRTYKLELLHGGKKVPNAPATWRGNPLSGDVSFYVNGDSGASTPENPWDQIFGRPDVDGDFHVAFGARDLYKFDSATETYQYRNERGFELRLTLERATVPDMWQLL